MENFSQPFFSNPEDQKRQLELQHLFHSNTMEQTHQTDSPHSKSTVELLKTFNVMGSQRQHKLIDDFIAVVKKSLDHLTFLKLNTLKSSSALFSESFNSELTLCYNTLHKFVSFPDNMRLLTSVAFYETLTDCCRYVEKISIGLNHQLDTHPNYLNKEEAILFSKKIEGTFGFLRSMEE